MMKGSINRFDFRPALEGSVVRYVVHSEVAGGFLNREGHWTRLRKEAMVFDRVAAAQEFCHHHQIQGDRLVLILVADQWIDVQWPLILKSPQSDRGRSFQTGTRSDG
jgi:hypothetical protein